MISYMNKIDENRHMYTPTKALPESVTPLDNLTPKAPVADIKIHIPRLNNENIVFEIYLYFDSGPEFPVLPIALLSLYDGPDVKS